MGIPIESLFEGIDATVILRLLPGKIAEAEERLAGTALILMAIRESKDVDAREVEQTTVIYNAQRQVLESLRAYQGRIEKSLKSDKKIALVEE